MQRTLMITVISILLLAGKGYKLGVLNNPTFIYRKMKELGIEI
ncbi:MAG: hypothetical protein ABIK93_03930 [candidate division WOR-3 bacterium]